MVKAVLLTALGAACLIRGLHNPVRALARRGAIRRCEGPNAFGACDTSIAVELPAKERVFSAAAGQVVAVGANYVHVLLRHETAILMYAGITPSVKKGQHVSSGQALGQAGSGSMLHFSVTQFTSTGVRHVSPTAWLASRGCKVVINNEGESGLWCAQGRDVEIPTEAQKGCDFSTPDKAGFALFPVNIEIR